MNKCQVRSKWSMPPLRCVSIAAFFDSFILLFFFSVSFFSIVLLLLCLICSLLFFFFCSHSINVYFRRVSFAPVASLSRKKKNKTIESFFFPEHIYYMSTLPLCSGNAEIFLWCTCAAYQTWCWRTLCKSFLLIRSMKRNAPTHTNSFFHIHLYKWFPKLCSFHVVVRHVCWLLENTRRSRCSVAVLLNSTFFFIFLEFNSISIARQSKRTNTQQTYNYGKFHILFN